MQVTRSGPDFFTDEGYDRRADGISTPGAGAARIIGVNGGQTNTTWVRSAAPADDRVLRFTVCAAAAAASPGSRPAVRKEMA